VYWRYQNGKFEQFNEIAGKPFGDVRAIAQDSPARCGLARRVAASFVCGMVIFAGSKNPTGFHPTLSSACILRKTARCGSARSAAG